MTQILIVAAVFTIAFLGMALSLHFSKYKKDGASCCGSGHCDSSSKQHYDGSSCYNSKTTFVNKFDTIKINSKDN